MSMHDLSNATLRTDKLFHADGYCICVCPTNVQLQFNSDSNVVRCRRICGRRIKNFPWQRSGWATGHRTRKEHNCRAKTNSQSLHHILLWGKKSNRNNDYLLPILNHISWSMWLETKSICPSAKARFTPAECMLIVVYKDD